LKNLITFGLSKADLKTSKFFLWWGSLAAAYIFWSGVAEASANFGPGSFHSNGNVALGLAISPIAFVAVSLIRAPGTYVVLICLIKFEKHLRSARSAADRSVSQSRFATAVWFALAVVVQVPLSTPATFGASSYVGFLRYPLSFLTVLFFMALVAAIRRTVTNRRALRAMAG
jgi:hypothetical protein